MKALLPHTENCFYWFVPCHECGVLVASGIFNQVEHAKKFHHLGEFTEAMCRQFDKKKKPVSEMTEKGYSNFFKIR